MAAGYRRIFIERKKTYGLMNYIMMSLILAFTIVISNTLVERGTDLKLLLICYLNIVFMIMLAWNHTNFLSLKYTQDSNDNDSDA
tara:strand:- start:1507 stop:1761 length:255 start_codon:yes stop_codon:yes gene_type:complete